MRNFKDLSRALASIAGGLKSIKDIIDTIEPGGGGGVKEWTLVSGSGSGTDTLSSTATDYDITDCTEIMIVLQWNSLSMSPSVINFSAFDPYENNNMFVPLAIGGGGTYVDVGISVADNTCSITAGANVTAYVYTR